MAASSAMIVKAMWLAVMCMAMVAPLTEAAISCDTVISNLSSCLLYVMGGATVPAGCCGGIKSLYNAASTTEDRKSICACLKSLAGSSIGVDYNKAASLPLKCGVNIPYKISPSLTAQRCSNLTHGWVD